MMGEGESGGRTRPTKDTEKAERLLLAAFMDNPYLRSIASV